MFNFAKTKESRTLRSAYPVFQLALGDKSSDFTLDLTKQFCIWFEVPRPGVEGSPDCLPDFHKLRLIQWREAQPEVHLRLIYSAEFLSKAAQQSLSDLCERLRIEPIDFKTQLPTMLKGDSDHKIFELACQEHDHCRENQGGNPASISDLVRVLRGLKGWLYTDFEYLKSPLPAQDQLFTVHTPFLTSISIEKGALKRLASDIWTWPTGIFAMSELWQESLIVSLHQFFYKKYNEKSRHYHIFRGALESRKVFKIHEGLEKALGREFNRAYEDVFEFRRTVLLSFSDNEHFIKLYRHVLEFNILCNSEMSTKEALAVTDIVEKLGSASFKANLDENEWLLLKQHFICLRKKIRFSAVEALYNTPEEIEAVIANYREQIKDVIWLALVVPFTGPDAIWKALTDDRRGTDYSVMECASFSYYPALKDAFGVQCRQGQNFSQVNDAAWRPNGQKRLEAKAYTYHRFLRENPFYRKTRVEREAAARTIQLAWQQYRSKESTSTSTQEITEAAPRVRKSLLSMAV